MGLNKELAKAELLMQEGDFKEKQNYQICQEKIARYNGYLKKIVPQ